MFKLIIGLIVIVVLAGGFFLFSGEDSAETLDKGLPDINVGASEGTGVGNDEIDDINGDSFSGTEGLSLWQTATFTDIATGEEFSISDFSGQNVLVESFAVWCPTCTKQQKNIKELHEEIGDSFVSISLDTDPNEDNENVLSHINSNGFDWLYAISPAEVTKSLIDEFGNSVVSAPQAPVILVCENGSSRFLSSGLKSVSKLKSEIDKGC